LSRLAKQFIVALSGLISLFIFLLLSTDYSRDREKQITNVSMLSKLPGIALSTSYLEKRVIYYDDYSNSLYPKMKNYSQVDFVYAK
jgi:hypothetical protein